MGFGSWWHWLVLLLIFLPKVLYLLSVQKTLKLIPEQHRKLSPGLVWLGLIPILYLLWNFIVVSRMRQSFESLKAAGQLEDDVDGGYLMGLVSSIFSAGGLIANVASSAILDEASETMYAIVGSAILMGWIATWIINWVQIVSSRRAIVRN
ncbi:MAG: hypothetical protein ABL936_09170 [Aestuariivirga sp.]